MEKTEKEKQWSDGKISKNKIEFQSEEYNKQSISFKALFAKSHEDEILERVILSTYVCDWEWLINCFEETVDLYIIVNWNKNTKESELPVGVPFAAGIKKAALTFPAQDHNKSNRKFHVIHPPTPFREQKKPMTITMHAKVIIAKFTNRMRVIISSSNATQEDWERLGQVIWWQDFAIAREKKAEEALGEFGVDLGEMMLRMGVQFSEAEKIPFCDSCFPYQPYYQQDFQAFCKQEVVEWLSAFDLSKATANLILSVPGVFNLQYGEEMAQFGHLHFRKIAQNLQLKKQTIYYQTSAIGDCSIRFMEQICTSLFGESFTMKKDQQNFKIIFPTIECIKKSLTNSLGCITIRFADKKMGTRTMLCKTVNENIEEEKSLTPLHSKMIFSLDDSMKVNWIYVGSHNFTQNSWGFFETNESFVVTNFEIGVLLKGEQIDGIDLNRFGFSYPVIPYSSECKPFVLSDSKEIIFEAKEKLQTKENFLKENYHWRQFLDENSKIFDLYKMELSNSQQITKEDVVAVEGETKKRKKKKQKK